MALSDIVEITLSLQAAALTRPGFGIPLVMAYDAPGGFTNRYRTYTSLAGLAADGFSTTGPTYKMVSAIMAQSPRPPLVGVGRCALPPAQVFSLTPSAPFTTGTVWAGTFDGIAWSYTQGGTQTLAAACTGITAALNAAVAGTLAVDTGGTSITITAASPGDFHRIGVTPLQTSTLKVLQTHIDPGVATDLNAINAENPAWYMVLCPFNSKLQVVALDAWIESAAPVKMGLFQTQDSDVINTAPAGTDVASTLAGTSALRTALIYKSTTDDFADAAWAGACLPLTPGSETWAFHTLVGVPVEGGAFNLSSTQRNNAVGSATSSLAGKYCNVYETIAGANVTESGYVSGNEWIDTIRFRDWLETNMSLDIFQGLINASSTGGKIPYTDAGIASVQAAILGRLKQGVSAGGLVGPIDNADVQVPLASAATSGQRAARTLAGVTFSAELAGAIQAVEITGTLSQ